MRLADQFADGRDVEKESVSSGMMMVVEIATWTVGTRPDPPGRRLSACAPDDCMVYGMNVNFAWPVMALAQPSSELPCGRERALMRT